MRGIGREGMLTWQCNCALMTEILAVGSGRYINLCEGNVIGELGKGGDIGEFAEEFWGNDGSSKREEH